MIASVPAVMYYLNDIDIISYIIKLNEKEKSKQGKKKKSHTPLLITMICILLAGILTYTVAGFAIDAKKLAKNNGENEDLNEVIAVMQKDMSENGIDELRLFNGFNLGGYLEFKGYKTYIDARADSFVDIANNDFDYLTEYYDIKSGNVYFNEVFDKYNFNYAIVDIKSEKPLYTAISNNDGYTLVFENDDTALFRAVK